MSDPFKFVNAINYTKENLVEDPENRSEYSPFLTNKSLSYFPETILYANEMNLHNQVDNDLQFSYLLNSVPKGKRFSKWVKPKKIEDLEAIMEYFDYGRVKAEEALKILSDDDITMIYSRTYRGGVNHEQRKNNKRSRGDPPKDA